MARKQEKIEKICLIQCPCGLGDIFFTRHIGLHYASLGYRVIWPVVSEFAWLNQYFDGIEYISWEDNERKLTHQDPLPEHVKFPYKEKLTPMGPSEFGEDFIYLNLFLPPQGPVMQEKYREARLPWQDYADYISFKRNVDKEKELYYTVLGLKDGEDFVLINRRYQMRPEVLFYDRISNNPADYGGRRVVEMEILDGFSLVDWLYVVERSSGLFTIETSLCYLLESPQMRNNLPKELNLFSRHNSFHQVRALFNVPWTYITH